MPTLQPEEPEVLAGVDLEQDCQTPVVAPDTKRNGARPDAEEHDHETTWLALQDGTAPAKGLDDWQPVRTTWARLLEKVALAVERPVNRFVGTTQLNPFYHTGTIAVLLLGIVGVTGTYLFFFFQYGYDESYLAVARMEHQFIARTMRAVHRYASGALVIATLLHAFRILFMERFRGPRWLAWVTGVVLTVIVWLAGVTGYWLVWDIRAQAIMESLRRGVAGINPFDAQLAAYLSSLEGTGSSWPVLVALFMAHLLLFLATVFFFWLHIRRLSRPKWYPDPFWIAGIGIVLLLAGIFFPVRTLAQANPTLIPVSIEFDPIFLFFLPIAQRFGGGWLWASLFVFVVIVTFLPWISRGKRKSTQPKVNVIAERCTGCTKCALDCPYGAIEMVERHDNKPHKFIAIADPALCVSCGICVGSCDGVAVTMGQTPPELLWSLVSAQLAFAQANAGPDGDVKVVFTCERHAEHGARPYLSGPHLQANGARGPVVSVVELPCVGAVPPDLLTRALDSGAAQVQVIGCPPDDCTNREGNRWTERRLLRKRVPRLRRAYANAPIAAAWTPPNTFASALAQPFPMSVDGDAEEAAIMNSRRMRTPLTWRNYLPALALLAAMLLLQIWLTSLPVNADAPDIARVQVILHDPSAPFGPFEGKWRPEQVFRLIVEVDGVQRYAETISAEVLFTPSDLLDRPEAILVEQNLELGVHHVRVFFETPLDGAQVVLLDHKGIITPGSVIRVQDARGPLSTCKGANCAR